MSKGLNIILVILLFVTVLSSTNVLAKVTRDPYSFLREVGKSTCSIFKTIGSSVTKVASKGVVKSLPNIKGKIVLVVPGHSFSSLSDQETKIFKGSDDIISTTKVIKLKGSHNGASVNLEGIGDTGRGYQFSFDLPFNNFCVPIKIKTKRFLPTSIFMLSYNDSSITADDISPGIKLLSSPNKVIIKGAIDTGVAEGRFRLRFSE